MELGVVPVFQIGRSPSSQLVLASDLVSRRHAVLQLHGSGRHLLIDMSSRNGTFLNGRRLSGPTLLNDGDQFKIGDFDFEYKTGGRSSGGDTMTDYGEFTHTDLQLTLVTTLVVDIRDFTVISQSADPLELSKGVAELWQRAGVDLERRGCWGRKMLGDGLLALWRHEKGNSNAEVLDALRGLGDIVAQAEVASVGGSIGVRISAGLNTGLVYLGNFGSGAAADHTALGDSVNKAFRLETATRQVGCDCLLGENTWQQVSGLVGREFGRECEVALKGYTGRVKAYAASFEELRALVAPAGAA